MRNSLFLYLVLSAQQDVEVSVWYPQRPYIEQHLTTKSGKGFGSLTNTYLRASSTASNIQSAQKILNTFQNFIAEKLK